MFGVTVWSSVRIVLLLEMTISYGREYRLGYLTSFDHSNFGWTSNAASVTMALEQAAKDGLLGDNSVRVIYKNDEFVKSLSMGGAIELYERYNVDAFIGLASSVITTNTGFLLSYWNLPALSQSSANPRLGDKSVYRSLIRMVSPYNKIGPIVTDIMSHFNWKRILLISRSTRLCFYAADSIFQHLSDIAVQIPAWIKFGESLEESELPYMMDSIRNKARVVYFCGNAEEKEAFMLASYQANLTTSEFAYIYTSYAPMDPVFEPWRDRSNPNHQFLKEANRGAVQLTLAPPSRPEMTQFLEEFVVHMAARWDYNMTEHGVSPSKYAGVTYDLAYLYAMVLNKTLEAGLDPRNGTTFMEVSRTIAFYGLSGHVALDGKGDRQPVCSLWCLMGDDDISTLWAEVDLSISHGKRMKVLENVVWHTTDGRPPPDTPYCGFQNDLCIKQDETMTMVVPITVSSLVILVVIGVLSVWIRKQRLDGQLNTLTWRVRYDELAFVNPIAFAKSLVSLKMIASSRTSMLRSSGPCSSRSANISRMDDSVQDGQIFTKVSLYKGQMASVKSVHWFNDFNRTHIEELKALVHENVSRFIGACIDPPNICLLTEYCPKGSLQDIIENDGIQLDNIFKESFVFDLVNGIQYLHSTFVNFHGNLKSSNCVVDNRWLLKVTDFYPSCCKPVRSEDSGDYEGSVAKLWTSPELLLNPTSRGSRTGDVYAISIILQEIFYRASPFFMETISPQVIISRVRACEYPPFRPKCPPRSDISPAFMELLKLCWLEDPLERPSIRQVKKTLMSIFKRGKVNITESLLAKLQVYSSNLENIVRDRTVALRGEKDKTESLLYQMLPVSVADKLKQGVFVSPEFYEEATVYFSDVVGFVELAAESSPIQVVEFLNELYALLDSIVRHYDVYKVETIGDSYMVVSGIPKRNGPRHAPEIADMSLHIMKSACSFQIRHKPDHQLQLRIGLHTGSCCAGIIGLVMPRYCLFGDTVNTTSRMESTGEGLKIHISGETYIALKTFGGYLMSHRGQVTVKGKGLLTTYWLDGKSELNNGPP